MSKKGKKVGKLMKEYGMDAVGIIAGVAGAAMGYGSADAFGGLPGVGAGTISAVKDLFTGPTSTPNPLFWLHGFDEEDSPLVDAYLRQRTLKKFGGALFSIAGVAASPFTMGVNPTAMGRHASSEAATLLHLYKLAALKKKFSQSDTVTGWIDLVVKMKIMKAVSQGAQLAINALPSSIASVGVAATVLGTGTSIATKVATKTMGGACMTAAFHLHWRAYRELKISGSGRGPATLIIKELFSRRHYTVLGGSYDYKGMIKEPGGWFAIYDKLLLL